MSIPAPFGRGEAALQQFGLRVRGLPDGVLVVATFKAENLALATDYALHIDAVSTVAALQLDELIAAPATLTMRWEGGERCLHGVIASAEHSGASADGQNYRLVLRSPLHALALRHGNRVFLGRNVADIAREVLEAAGLAADAFRVELANEPQPREFVAQYDQSDLDFLQRQFAYHGLTYAFEHGAEQATLVITDDVGTLAGALGTVALDYQPLSGQTRNATTVYGWSPKSAETVRGVRLHDYNPDTPRQMLEVEVGEGGGAYRFGEHYGDRAEGERLARLRLQAHAWKARRVSARTACRAVLPGARIALSGGPVPGADGDWLIVQAEIEGDQRSGIAYGKAAKKPVFQATLTMIPADVPYRTPCEAPRRMQGYLTARVEGDGGDYAHLNEQGCYQLRLPYDLSDRPDAEASHPVRQVQPYGGAGYGMHFPLHHGTEVAVAHVNGDVDRPIILGALFNPASPSPVTAANPSQNVLRTHAGNELLMEDRKGEERIELFTPERRNRLALDAHADGHRITLESQAGDVELRAGGNMRWEAGRDQHVEVGGNHTVIVHKDQRLLTREGDIALKAAKDLSLKAEEDMQFQAARGNLSLHAGKDLIASSGAGMSLTARGGNASIRVEQGDLNVQAARAITVQGEGGGPIRIGQPDGTIEITAGGNLAIDAPKVKITAGSIAIKAKSIGNNS